MRCVCLEAGGTWAFILKCLRGGQLPGSESESVMAPVTGNPSLIPAIYTAEDRCSLVTLSLFPLSNSTDVFCLPAVQPSGLNCPFNVRDLTACLGIFSSAFVRLTLNIYMTSPFLWITLGIQSNMEEHFEEQTSSVCRGFNRFLES